MYEITALFDMDNKELIAFAKGVNNTDLGKTKAGQFYVKEAMNLLKYRLDMDEEDDNESK